MPAAWFNDLKKRVKCKFLTDEKSLVKYSHDTSILEIKPKVIALPKNTNQIKSLVKFTQSNKAKYKDISLTVRSGGTDMTGGPLNESIIIDISKNFDKIISFFPKKKTITIQPGILYKDFEIKLNEHHLLLPTYPASKSICTVGGMIANNAGGEKSLQYGKTNKYILEIKSILSDGNEYTFNKLSKKQLQNKLKQKNFEGKLYKEIFSLINNNYQKIQNARPNVSKNSAGYYLWDVYDKKTFDLTQLIVGSQGTLGIITEAKLKLVNKKKHSRLIVCFLKDVNALGDFVNIVLPFKPESLETYDDATNKLAIRFFPEIAKKLNKSLLSFLFEFRREALTILMHGFPKFTVLVELTDDNESKLKSKIEKLHEKFKDEKVPHNIMNSEEEGEKYWTIRRESFNLLRKKVSTKKATPFIDDFIIKPEKFSKFLPELNKILKEHDVKPTFAGHAGSGNFHIIPLMDLTKKSERDKIPIVSKKVYELIVKYKGSITAEHNDGLIRSPYLELMYGKDIMRLFEKTKKIFDPKNIFNPGKKVHSNMNYAMKHIKTS